MLYDFHLCTRMKLSVCGENLQNIKLEERVNDWLSDVHYLALPIVYPHQPCT